MMPPAGHGLQSPARAPRCLQAITAAS